ncbi:MAG: hypothetical protein M3O36_11045 [Myxococcota bacterium]|nr:hypothetical protein [Myxococcota bacterium]
MNEQETTFVSHADLIHSSDVDGGFRVSTSIIRDAGFPEYGSMTVSTNYGQNSVTMKPDGSVDIIDDGKHVSMDGRDSIMLSGGAGVDYDYQDGARSVYSKTRHGGWIDATMYPVDGGFEIDATQIGLGGDAIDLALAHHHDIAAARTPEQSAAARITV